MQGPSVRIGLPETGTVRDAHSRPVLSWENSVAEPRNKATPGITVPGVALLETGIHRSNEQSSAGESRRLSETPPKGRQNSR